MNTPERSGTVESTDVPLCLDIPLRTSLIEEEMSRRNSPARSAKSALMSKITIEFDTSQVDEGDARYFKVTASGVAEILPAELQGGSHCRCEGRKVEINDVVNIGQPNGGSQSPTRHLKFDHNTDVIEAACHYTGEGFTVPLLSPPTLPDQMNSPSVGVSTVYTPRISDESEATTPRPMVKPRHSKVPVTDPGSPESCTHPHTNCHELRLTKGAERLKEPHMYDYRELGMSRTDAVQMSESIEPGCNDNRFFDKLADERGELFINVMEEQISTKSKLRTDSSRADICEHPCQECDILKTQGQIAAIKQDHMSTYSQYGMDRQTAERIWEQIMADIATGVSVPPVDFDNVEKAYGSECAEVARGRMEKLYEILKMFGERYDT